jgi:hypothetical protein
LAFLEAPRQPVDAVHQLAKGDALTIESKGDGVGVSVGLLVDEIVQADVGGIGIGHMRLIPLEHQLVAFGDIAAPVFGSGSGIAARAGAWCSGVVMSRKESLRRIWIT